MTSLLNLSPAHKQWIVPFSEIDLMRTQSLPGVNCNRWRRLIFAEISEEEKKNQPKSPYPIQRVIKDIYIRK